MRIFPAGSLWLLRHPWTQKILPNESEMWAGKGRREDTQLEEGDVIKTKHISFHSSSCPTPARLAITFPSAFLAFFFLNWVHPNWYLVSFHPYQQLAVSKRLNSQNVIFPQAEWGTKFPFCLKQKFLQSGIHQQSLVRAMNAEERSNQCDNQYGKLFQYASTLRWGRCDRSNLSITDSSLQMEIKRISKGLCSVMQKSSKWFGSSIAVHCEGTLHNEQYKESDHCILPVMQRTLMTQ